MDTHAWYSHILIFLSGSSALGIVSHALCTCPTPKNIYAQWLLGIAKYIVGQRISAANAMNGLQSEVTAVTDKQKEALNNGSTLQIVKTPEGVTKPLPISENK